MANKLTVWPREPSEKPPLIITMPDRSDIEYIAKCLGFSLKSLETDGVALTETHFICYEGINPYQVWNKLLEDWREDR